MDASSAIALNSSSKTATPPDGTGAHLVTVEIEGQTIGPWTEYEILNSMVEPADGFSMSMPFNRQAWKSCELDARVRVLIDGVVKLDGFIDDRTRSAKAGTIAIAGRDRSGRLVQESIPTTAGFDGLNLDAAVLALAKPWYTAVTFSDTRNRSVARGKGHRASAGNEPAFFKVKGKLDQNHAGKVDPGETRWNVIEQLCSSIGVLCWSSADGQELVLGVPNYSQGLQWLFRHSVARGSTVRDLVLKESVADGFALIEANCAGQGGADDYGDGISSFAGKATDGPNPDGTGADFKYPKRLVVTERGATSNAEAQKTAERHMKRSGFNRRQLTIDAPLHGQVLAGTQRTLFTPNTMARVIDDELPMDEAWLVYACRFRGGRGGETTDLMLVPRGTDFVS
jgi:prophage tail gpP-like protein